MEKACERCGKRPVGYQLLDYCAECSRDLCSECMATGCCGRVPAVSGTEADLLEDANGHYSQTQLDEMQHGEWL